MNFEKESYGVMSKQINEQMHSYSAEKEIGIIKSRFFDKGKNS